MIILLVFWCDPVYMPLRYPADAEDKIKAH